jgi:hypothetical protein
VDSSGACPSSFRFALTPAEGFRVDAENRRSTPNSRSLARSVRIPATAPPATGRTGPVRSSDAETPACMAGDSSAPQHLLLNWKGVHDSGATPTPVDVFAQLGDGALADPGEPTLRSAAARWSAIASWARPFSIVRTRLGSISADQREGATRAVPREHIPESPAGSSDTKSSEISCTIAPRAAGRCTAEAVSSVTAAATGPPACGSQVTRRPAGGCAGAEVGAAMDRIGRGRTARRRPTPCPPRSVPRTVLRHDPTGTGMRSPTAAT